MEFKMSLSVIFVLLGLFHIYLGQQIRDTSCCKSSPSEVTQWDHCDQEGLLVSGSQCYTNSQGEMVSSYDYINCTKNGDTYNMLTCQCPSWQECQPKQFDDATKSCVSSPLENATTTTTTTTPAPPGCCDTPQSTAVANWDKTCAQLGAGDHKSTSCCYWNTDYSQWVARCDYIKCVKSGTNWVTYRMNCSSTATAPESCTSRYDSSSGCP